MSKKTDAAKLAEAVKTAQQLHRSAGLQTETGKPERRQAAKPDGEKVERITVGTKARKEIAYHWTVQAKIKRRSITDVVQDALIAEFGLPDGFTKEDI